MVLQIDGYIKKSVKNPAMRETLLIRRESTGRKLRQFEIHVRTEVVASVGPAAKLAARPIATAQDLCRAGEHQAKCQRHQRLGQQLEVKVVHTHPFKYAGKRQEADAQIDQADVRKQIGEEGRVLDVKGHAKLRDHLDERDEDA